MTEKEKLQLHSTAIWLEKVRMGDVPAREKLFAAYLPILNRWAHGRLPHYARNMLETNDLVQTTLIQAFTNIGSFRPAREGSFLAYLRRILLNQIRDEIRKANRRPYHDDVDQDFLETTPSLVEQTVGGDLVANYEAALATIPELQREAVILRIELGFTFPEIAAALGCPSANAARMMVSRALVLLAESMS